MGALWRLLGYLKPYMHRLIGAWITLSISGALMALIVSTVKPLVNEVLLGGRATPVTAAETGGSGPDILTRVQQWLPLDSLADWAMDHAFVQVPLLIVVIFVVRGFFLYFGQYHTIKAGASVIRDMRTELYEAVAYQSLGFFQEHPTGTILSRILNDVQRLQRVTTVSKPCVR